MATCVHAVVYTSELGVASGSKVFSTKCEPLRLSLPSHAHFTTWSPQRCHRKSPSCSGRLSRHSAPQIKAIATIDQGSPHPLTPRAPTANQIFDAQHVPQISPSLMLYFPLGVCLASIRMALWVILLAADMPWLTDNNLTITVLQRILGLKIVWKHSERLPAERHVLVSNHVTAGDLMVLYSLPQHYVHLISAQLPKRISQAKHHRVRLWHATKQVYEGLARTSEHSESIHLFPGQSYRMPAEGGMTNGAGMVRFSRGFMRFGKSLPIVPVALKVSVPWGIRTHTLTSNFAANLFWFCFVPYIQLEATVLKPMTLQEGQGNGAFVESVQQAIAEQLDIGIADITFQEKKQLIRQYRNGKH